MRTRVSVELLGASLLAALGIVPAAGCGSDAPSHECVDPEPVLSGGKDTGFDLCKGGYMRRREALQCPSALPRVDMCTGGDPATNACATDADCTEKPNGFCSSAAFEGPSCFCNYGCTTDAECGAGSICLCGDPVGQCAVASCTSTADCADGASCTEYTANPGCGGTGFACQTATDECATDADCTANMQCSFEGGRHVCSPMTCVIGRPFLVGGAPRLADKASRSDWSTSDVLPSVEDLSPEQRAELCERWARAALMEHASVAAFARFALQLLGMGAPSELLQRTQEAMADEIEHARLCFALASAYGGESVGPGALSVSGALEESDPRRVLAMVIREGCIGETVAAIEAAEARDHATDPVVRDVLEKIARDEGRHAELAWRTVKWAIERGGPALCDAVRAEIEAALREPPPSPKQARGTFTDEELLSRGLVGESLRAELHALALARAVRPAALALLGRDGPTSTRGRRVSRAPNAGP